MRSLRSSAKDYLALRRALGFKLQREEAWLLDFVAFMERNHANRVTRKRVLQWLRRNNTGSSSYQALRFTAIRGFASYRSAIDPHTDVPPADLVPPAHHRKRFYLYSDEDIRRLLAEALKSRSGATSITKWVRYTLLGLLSVTGLRIGEALNLDVDDVDLAQGILTIRNSKFGKSRLVPVHPSTRTALKKYLRRRNEYFKGRSIVPFFVTQHGTRMTRSEVQDSFVRMSRKTGLRGPDDRYGPRLNDFRHSAAMRALIQCYRSRANPDRRLPAISTYLGHTNLRYTYWYLHQSPALTKEVVRRLERYWEHVP